MRGTAIASPAALPTETETACGALVAPFKPAPDPVPGASHLDLANPFWFFGPTLLLGPALLLADLLPGAKAQSSSPPPTPWYPPSSVHLWTSRCPIGGTQLLTNDCLFIDEPFLLAFVAGECIDDIHKVRSADACLELGGSFTSSTGAVTDAPCSPGTAQPDLGHGTCNNCAAGKYQADPGQTACDL